MLNSRLNMNEQAKFGGQRFAQRGTTSGSEIRDESYFLLLELITQEPTMQNCFKVIEGSCLAQGVQLKVGGGAPSKAFQRFMDMHYISFCEQAVKCMFACGFVPWRLRKLPTGDPVPEVIPFGLYTWTVENASVDRHPYSQGAYSGRTGNPGDGAVYRNQRPDRPNTTDPYTRMAQLSFQKQNNFFKSNYVPYQLQGDIGTMGKKVDKKDEPTAKKQKLQQFQKHNEGEGDAEEGDFDPNKDGKPKKKQGLPSALFLRQQDALRRQQNPYDNDSTKLLQYKIHFTRNCNCLEEDIEIYEYIHPSADVTLNSILYRTVPSPMSHILIDYRNLRHAMIRREYADNWNTQSKMVCSYSAQKNIYSVNEGNPIINDWSMPQNRLGLPNDRDLPTELDQNAYTRDAITEQVVGSKDAVHKPVVYTLPKNSKLENIQHLESIQNIEEMQQKFAKDISSIMGVPFEIIGGGYSAKQANNKAMENGRVFTTNMVNICRHLQNLLKDVYIASYGGESEEVVFTLRPTPRIEINTVEDLALLMETGVVSFDNAMTISNMLLGVDLQQAAGKSASAGQFSRSFVTPNHKKDLIVAAAAAEKKATQPPAKPKPK